MLSSSTKGRIKRGFDVTKRLRSHRHVLALTLLFPSCVVLGRKQPFWFLISTSVFKKMQLKDVREKTWCLAHWSCSEYISLLLLTWMKPYRIIHFTHQWIMRIGQRVFNVLLRKVLKMHKNRIVHGVLRYPSLSFNSYHLLTNLASFTLSPLPSSKLFWKQMTPDIISFDP